MKNYHTVLVKITFLGTGSIIPSPRQKNIPQRSYSAVLVELKSETLLFDIGPGTLSKMQLLGIDTRIKPDHLFISHFHIDHCQDFIALVKGRCFDPTSGKAQPAKALSVYGPPELKSWSLDLFTKVKRWNYMDKALSAFSVLNLREETNGVLAEGKNWKVTCIPVKHYDGIAFRLDSQGKSFIYSGDMGYDENLTTLGQNVDFVAIECSYPDKKTLKGLHLCPEDIGKLAKLGNFKTVALTHLYPQCEGKEEEMIKTVEKLSGSKVLVAHDFLTIDL